MKGALDFRWGLIIGGANLLWLVASFYLGMHESIEQIQCMSLVAVLIYVIGQLFAIRSLMSQFPETDFREGLRFGAIVAGVSAAVAVLGHRAEVGVRQPRLDGWREWNCRCGRHERSAG